VVVVVVAVLVTVVVSAALGGIALLVHSSGSEVRVHDEEKRDATAKVPERTHARADTEGMERVSAVNFGSEVASPPVVVDEDNEVVGPSTGREVVLELVGLYTGSKQKALRWPTWLTQGPWLRSVQRSN